MPWKFLFSFINKKILSFKKQFLHQLAFDMQLQSYTFHYALDFPALVKNCNKTCVLTEQHGSQMMHKELLQVQAPNVFFQLECILRQRDSLPYNYIEDVNNLTRNVLQVNICIQLAIDSKKQCVLVRIYV